MLGVLVLRVLCDEIFQGPSRPPLALMATAEVHVVQHRAKIARCRLYRQLELRVGTLEVATQVAAETIKDEVEQTPNHANRIVWAREALASPKGMGGRMFDLILVQNRGVSVTTIKGLPDSALQAAVNGAVDFFAG